MSEPVTLTDTERETLAEAERMSDLYDWRPKARIAAVESIITRRVAEALRDAADRVEALSDELVQMSNEGTTLLTITKVNQLVCSLVSKDQWLDRAAEFEAGATDGRISDREAFNAAYIAARDADLTEAGAEE